MIRLIVIALALVFSVGVAGVSAQEAQKSFWDGLRSKIEKVTPTKKTSVTTAVGGVRGAKNDDGGELYWKGKEETLNVSAEELTAFNAAVQVAVDGDSARATELFEAFVASYPTSALRQDSLLALENLKAGAQ
ncbi:MAG: hypothetical protein K0A93_05260 [Desulfuromonadaceae bacterium]|nr:hypothetical protein [Desulfuromonadaceae bacterium]